MPWFRKSAADPLAVSMAGLKLGDRLLVLGCSDTALIAALAAKVGLTGRACMLDESEEVRARAARVVEQNGALAESFAGPVTTLLFDWGSFDVGVVRNLLHTLEPARQAASLNEVRRVLRPGGRCIVIDDGRRGGLAGLLSANPAAERYATGGGASPLLTAAGFRAVRNLAEREGLIFVEGVKAGKQGSG
jgi:ubiquinone/menaquinone biosynthesis C-methylase UbiE